METPEAYEVIGCLFGTVYSDASEAEKAEEVCLQNGRRYVNCDDRCRNRGMDAALQQAWMQPAQTEAI